MKPTHLSLFSGIGGLDLAAEAAGFETVGQCEWADFPTKVLEKHWPDVPRWRDIRTLTKESFYAKTGIWTVDIVSGGFPCQPFSTAGKRRGKNDDRYLWGEMLRVVAELRPTWVIGENVAGLISMAEPDSDLRVEGGTNYRTADMDYYQGVYTQSENMLLCGIIRQLEEIGYSVQVFTFPACAVDAKHRRDRICIVGYTEHNGLSAAEVGRSAVSPSDYQSERTDQTGESKRAGKQNNSEVVADTKSLRRQRMWPNGQQMRGTRFTKRKPERCGYVRNSTSKRLSDWTKSQVGKPRTVTKSKRPNWWPAEPNVGRVANGVSNRVDKLKGLGNAVVPAQFYPIFKAIYDITYNPQG